MLLQSLGLMYVGRVIYGLGGENMAVGTSVILAEWFQNKEMALAMALQVAVSRIGSVINNVMSPAIADGSGVPTALWVGAIICGARCALACRNWPRRGLLFSLTFFSHLAPAWGAPWSSTRWTWPLRHA